jgi:two-component system response regulator AtoC
MPLPLALVFDSHEDIRTRASDALAGCGFEPLAATTPQEALEFFRAHPIAAAILGIASPAEMLFDLLGRGVKLRPRAVVAVLDSGGSLRALEAARAGAFELLSRPPDADRLAAFALRAAAQVRLLEEVRRAGLDDPAGGHEPIVGRSEAIEGVRRKIARLAEAAGPVLFVGERGTGRRHAARALFARWGLEPEIVAGGSPDAETRIFAGVPAVHVADLENLPWRAQERLAEALTARRNAMRITASTSLDPRTAAREGRLHGGLVDAFGSSVVEIPSLRERPEDVPLLARSFVEGLRRLNALPPIALAPEAIRALEGASWSGNVHELRNAVETAIILASDGIVREADLPAALREAGTPASGGPGLRADRSFREAKRSVVHAFERVYLTDLLERHRGNVTGAASRSGMLRSALQRLLRKHDLRSAAFRPHLDDDLPGNPPA